MQKILLLASGGSGDALVSSIISSELGINSSAAIATVIWERRILDPIPGPRSINQVSGLLHENGLHRICGRTRIPSGMTPLAKLSSLIETPIYFLDLEDGVVGLAVQIEKICRQLDITDVWIVDVGGDLIAEGVERGLVSTTLDACFLAMTALTTPDARIVVAGPGLDGELTECEVERACKLHSMSADTWLDAKTASTTHSKFNWWPSETPLLALLACAGIRGQVEINPRSAFVTLNSKSSQLLTGCSRDITSRRQFISALSQTRTFAEIRRIIAEAGYRDEVEYEESARRKDPNWTDKSMRDSILDYLHSSSADFVTVRALCKAFGVHTHHGLRKIVTTLEVVEEFAFINPLVQLAP